MAKLTPEKVRWIVQQKCKGAGNSYIAWAQSISIRRVQQIWATYRKTGEIPELKLPGRPSKPFTPEEISLVLEAHQATDLGATGLEICLQKTHAVAMSHNRIHRILKEHEKALDEPKKQKRRSWVRYERDHSMELWHTDWKQLPDGNWFIAFQDDSSRFILNYGVFPERNQQNVFVVLEEAIERYGIPDEILTDRGSEFYTNAQKGKKQGTSQFTMRLGELGIKHIVARVNHPQTNGKLERFHGEIEKRWVRFHADVRKIVDWHNHVKPHRSLKFNRGETPSEAFVRKYPPERVFQSIAPWFWS